MRTTQSTSHDTTPLATLRAARTIARRLTSNQQEREDLAADALLGWIEHAHRKKLSDAEMWSQPNWLVLKCRAIDRLRRRRTISQTLERYSIDPTVSRVTDELETAQLDLKRALGGCALSKDDQSVLSVVYSGGGNIQDLARLRGWSHATARRRHRRCLKRLREAVGLSFAEDGQK